jgi:S-adenosylmethionine hydrolase
MHAYRYFPAGTTHVGVVDPGVGTDRSILALVHDGHAFVAPDNGLIAPLAERPGARTFKVDLRKPDRFGLGPISATFHGRDILAPLGAALASGRLRPEDLGPVADSVVPSLIEEPAVSGGRVRGVVVAVDSFGNLMTNIAGRHVRGLRNPVVEAGGHTFPLRRTYADVTPGDFLGLINSFDALELACAEQSAADGLRLGRGAPVVVRGS